VASVWPDFRKTTFFLFFNLPPPPPPQLASAGGFYGLGRAAARGHRQLDSRVQGAWPGTRRYLGGTGTPLGGSPPYCQ